MEHISRIEPIKSLAEATERFRRHNDQVAKSQSAERGSVPPSAPSQPVVLTAERRVEIARVLKRSHPILTSVHLLPLEPHVTAAEFFAFVDSAARAK